MSLLWNPSEAALGCRFRSVLVYLTIFAVRFQSRLVLLYLSLAWPDVSRRGRRMVHCGFRPDGLG
ncbi:hypothetical protein BD309DRAFT_950090 [Dichomitus squalens]|nr:hypothetical protein BD309DRAFT_950090 [Dichomitus squalens]